MHSLLSGIFRRCFDTKGVDVAVREQNAAKVTESDTKAMPKDADEPVSFTDTNAETGAQNNKATGSAMMDLISGLQKKRGGSESSGSTGKEEKRRKKRKKRGKTVTKRKRRKDRYESQNYLLRIEGTLCCASLIVAMIFIVAIFIVFLICGIWSRFDTTATTESVKEL